MSNIKYLSKALIRLVICGFWCCVNYVKDSFAAYKDFEEMLKKLKKSGKGN